MTLSEGAILALALQCAPNVAPQTVVAIVRTESSGNPLAINVNGARQPPPQRSIAEAAATARRHVTAGYSVDLGLGQINSRNMRKLGLTWRTVFDPCTNIAALGRLLTANYQSSLGGRHPQNALRVAFSLYNTGNTSRGFRNGYVGRVVGNAGFREVNSTLGLPVAAPSEARLSIEAETASDASADLTSMTPPWDVFGRAASARQPVQDRRKSVWAE